jgi:hypothetical protein
MTDKQYYFPRVHYSTRIPTVNDDSTKGFLVGCVFENTLTGDRYICRDNSAGASVWFKEPGYIDPTESTSPSAQASIDESSGCAFLTPQILFQDITIAYNVWIRRNALSAGPITIADGYTVTVEGDGVWTVV